MPAYMAQQRSSSADMRTIRRELERRRKLAVVAKGGVAKKSSAPPIPPAPGGAAARKSSAAPPTPHVPAQAAINKASAPPPLPSSAASESIKRGATVLVRTRVGTLPTGQCLVLWLSAVVVSAVEEGYLEVIYNGDFPRDDPFRTVRVGRDQVKNMPPHK